MNGRFGNPLANGAGAITGLFVPDRLVCGDFFFTHFGFTHHLKGGTLNRAVVADRTRGDHRGRNCYRGDTRVAGRTRVNDRRGDDDRLGRRDNRHRFRRRVGERFDDRRRVRPPAAGGDTRRRPDRQRRGRQDNEDDDPVRLGNQSHFFKLLNDRLYCSLGNVCSKSVCMDFSVKSSLIV